MMNNLKESTQIDSITRLISWAKIKQKTKDALTLFPTQQLMLETYVIRADGTIREHHKGKAHSYTIGWLQHIEGFIGHAYNVLPATIAMTSTSNAAKSVQTFYSSGASYGGVNAGNGITTYGILVGSGTTAVTPLDYKIQTLIAHGSGAGQLNYGTCVTIGSVAGATTCSLAVTRLVANATGSDVTINEIGLVVSSMTATTQDYFMVVHDLATQVLHTGEAYLIIYTMATSISS